MRSVVACLILTSQFCGTIHALTCNGADGSCVPAEADSASTMLAKQAIPHRQKLAVAEASSSIQGSSVNTGTSFSLQEGIICSGDVAASSPDSEVCKAQCAEDATCVGVAATNDKWSDSPWCVLCRDTEGASKHEGVDVYWKDQHGTVGGHAGTSRAFDCPPEIPVQIPAKGTEIPSLKARQTAVQPAARIITQAADSVPQIVKDMLTTGVIPDGWADTAKSRGIKSVGVIGAGPSGLVSAKMLQQAGFQVTVLEAKDKVGGAAHSVHVNETGKTQDLATVWLPTISAAEPTKIIGGVPPLQAKIIDDVKEVGLTVRTGMSGAYLNMAVQPPQPFLVPAIVASSCSTAKMLSDFIIGLNYLVATAHCPGVVGFAECGFANLTESLEDWGRSRNLECFTLFVGEFVDLLGDGLAQKEFVGYPLKTRSYFLIGSLLKVLGKFKLFDPNPTAEIMQLKALLPQMGPWVDAFTENPAKLVEVLSQPTFREYEQGYQGFWGLFVRRYNLTVHLSDSVTRVVGTSGNLTVETASANYKFDHVVVAAPPKAMSQFMSSEYAPYWIHTATVGVEAALWKTDEPMPAPHAAAFYPAVCQTNLGGSSGAVHNGQIYIAADEYADGTVKTQCFPTKDNLKDGAPACDPAILKAMGLGTPRLLDRIFREWPTVVEGPKYKALHDWVKANQGRNGLTFVGEEISGNNVPSIIDHVSSLFVSNGWLGSDGSSPEK